jgi:DMSO/TMAO reductase YedYZ heme-binding membrane subunit/uncharacterized protein with FMN-binding domain
MWAGAMPNGSIPIKKIMPIRGELSIFAALLTLGHNIGFGRTYFVRLFTDSDRMTSNQIAASIMTIVLLVIMIPLTVMSFPQIRRKMNAKLWKKIQRTAYIFYALIYIHVLVISYPMLKAGREGYIFSIFMYSVVFVGYGVCRVRKWYIMRKKPENNTVVNIIGAIIFVILMIAVMFISRSENKSEEKTPQQYTVSDVTTTSTDTVHTSVTSTTTISTTTVVSSTSSSGTGSTDASATSVSTGVTTTTVTTVQTEDDEEISVSDEDEQQDDAETEEVQQEVQEEQVNNSNSNNEVQNPVQQETPVEEPQPSYKYRNGTYSASAYGYDGNVYVTVTIENDVIIDITAYTEESDEWYFNSAEGSVISQIISSQDTNVDAVSGATYSSEAIMSAVHKALNSAAN